jgi:hypothetical protein
MNAKAASRVEAIASIRVFVFARIPPPEDEKKEALRSCSLRGFDFILVILVFVVFGDGDGGCRRGQRGEQRGEQKKKEEEEEEEEEEEGEDSAFAVFDDDDSIIISIIFIYTRNCFVVVLLFCFVLFCFVFFQTCANKKKTKRTLFCLCHCQTACVWRILFNSITTHTSSAQKSKFFFWEKWR